MPLLRLIQATRLLKEGICMQMRHTVTRNNQINECVHTLILKVLNGNICALGILLVFVFKDEKAAVVLCCGFFSPLFMLMKLISCQFVLWCKEKRQYEGEYEQNRLSHWIIINDHFLTINLNWSMMGLGSFDFGCYFMLWRLHFWQHAIHPQYTLHHCQVNTRPRGNAVQLKKWTSNIEHFCFFSDPSCAFEMELGRIRWAKC